jgi:NAD(P)-dependent dehydrogenase (short-subunit alcohol dehydrogenase family)
MNSLRGQVALVMGSLRGIGVAIAKSFAQQGAKVVVHGRDGAALSSLVPKFFPSDWPANEARDYGGSSVVVV